MDWSKLTDLQPLGWPTAISLMVALAGLIAGTIYESRKRHAKELQDAEKTYRQAVASGDPDRIHIAARRLRHLRRQAP